MIKSFSDKTAADIYHGVASKDSRKVARELHGKIRRLFDQINASPSVETLKVPPSNRLEKLRGKLRRYWSLRINNQWRIIFRWEDGNAFEIKIIDYH